MRIPLLVGAALTGLALVLAAAPAAAVNLTIGAGAGLATPAEPAAEPAPVRKNWLTPRKRVELFAFAKASPLTGYLAATLQGTSSSLKLEYGKPYSVISLTADAAEIEVDGKRSFVKRGYLSLSRQPVFLVSNKTYFQRLERARIRFWDSSLRLSQFLVGSEIGDTRPDFQEFLINRPDFGVSWPVVSSDTIEILGGEKQSRIVNVLVPITRAEFDTFDRIAAGASRTVKMAIVADVSGSARGFLEPVLEDLGKSFHRDPDLSKIGAVDFTLFGGNAAPRRIPRVSLDSLVASNLFSGNSSSPNDEPLVPALALAADAMPPADDVTNAMLVLSGADVSLTGTVNGRSVKIEELPLGSYVTVFVQITPEPGKTLQEASRRAGLGNFIGFSDSGVAGQIVSVIKDRLRSLSSVEIAEKDLKPIADIANERNQMALLPMNAVGTSHLPDPPPFARNAEWYTASLWVVLDSLVLQLQGDPDAM